MDVTLFQKGAPGTLVPIHGTDALLGPWSHQAFVPHPLPATMPALTATTFLQVSNARAALAALDSTAKQLPNPTLLRMPTLQREAQSTSALEGTYAPLAEVLFADDDAPGTGELVEILNYVRMATYGFTVTSQGRPLTAGLVRTLQALLVRGTPLESSAGRLRSGQVVIGRRPEATPGTFPAIAARFVPPPPGLELERGLSDLVEWMRSDHRDSIDPVVSAAMAHYQFETLHPFPDGNGRVGRFLIVLYLMMSESLSEPTLTVSPWFESRREEYYDRLLGVSTSGNWDGYVEFFARGIEASAKLTRNQMLSLVAVQEELHGTVRASNLRADSAHAVIDIAIAHPSFTLARVEEETGLSYGRSRKLISQLVEMGVIKPVDPHAYKRRYFAPSVLKVLTQTS